MSGYRDDSSSTHLFVNYEPTLSRGQSCIAERVQLSTSIALRTVMLKKGHEIVVTKTQLTPQ